jgi:murein DD-endopeptidase MepM/ murein hydrolase activator NlpD
VEKKNVTDERLRCRDLALPSYDASHMSLDAEFSARPGAGEQAAPTRRQSRAVERAAVGENGAPTRRQLRELERAALYEGDSQSARQSVEAPAEGNSGRDHATAVAAAAAAKTLPHTRGKTLASKVASCVAMLFAGALLVGVSVPSNAFIGSVDMAAAAPEAAAASLAAESHPAQSVAVPDEVVRETIRQDNIKVISYADVLALHYAGVSYEYRATAGAIRWPFPYEVAITDGFGDRIGGFHKGTDFAAGYGTPIYAIADGVVLYVQADWSGYGYNAIITHVLNGQKIESQYAHMITNSSPLMVGDPVRVGDFVGLVGNTGISYGAHLHLEIHPDGVPVDPFEWLKTNAVN